MTARWMILLLAGALPLQVCTSGCAGTRRPADEPKTRQIDIIVDPSGGANATDLTWMFENQEMTGTTLRIRDDIYTDAAVWHFRVETAPGTDVWCDAEWVSYTLELPSGPPRTLTISTVMNGAVNEFVWTLGGIELSRCDHEDDELWRTNCKPEEQEHLSGLPPEIRGLKVLAKSARYKCNNGAPVTTTNPGKARLMGDDDGPPAVSPPPASTPR